MMARSALPEQNRPGVRLRDRFTINDAFSIGIKIHYDSDLGFAFETDGSLVLGFCSTALLVATWFQS